MPSNILLSDLITSKALASDQSSDSSKFSLSGQNNVPSKNISNYSVNYSSDIPDSFLSSDPTLLPISIPNNDPSFLPSFIPSLLASKLPSKKIVLIAMTI